MSESGLVEQISVRMTIAERVNAEKLAAYLFKVGKLDEPTIAGAIRAALRFITNEITKSVERERYG